MSSKVKEKSDAIFNTPPLPPSFDGYHAYPSHCDVLSERAFLQFYNHLGEKETGNNTGPVVEWAIAPWSKAKPDSSGWAQWCAAAVCTAYLEAGSSQIKDIASTNANTLWERLVRRGQAYHLTPSSQPKIGDLVFFEHHGKIYHVGLVKHYNPVTKQLITLEGNANDSVRLCERVSFHGFASIAN